MRSLRPETAFCALLLLASCASVKPRSTGQAAFVDAAAQEGLALRERYGAAACTGRPAIHVLSKALHHTGFVASQMA